MIKNVHVRKVRLWKKLSLSIQTYLELDRVMLKVLLFLFHYLYVFSYIFIDNIAIRFGANRCCL